MQQNTIAYLLVAVTVLAIASGQILFKTVSGQIHGLTDIFTQRATFITFASAMCLYGLSTFAWIGALRYLPLSHAYLFMSLGFIIVPIAAQFIFGETLGLRWLIGTALIISGILVAGGR